MLTLTAADGTAISAAHAGPTSPPRVGVVVLPDVRGLRPYYVALVERCAQAGLVTVAIDWFGSTAGACPEGVRPEDLDRQSHIPRATVDGIDAYVDAGVPGNLANDEGDTRQ